MKLFEKLKNTFFEEEYVEVEEDKEEAVAKKVEVKEEVKAEEKPVIRYNGEVREEEKPKEIKEEPVKLVNNYSDRELVKKNNNLPYYDDADFIEDEDITSYKPEKKEDKTKKLYGEDVSHSSLKTNYNVDTKANGEPYGEQTKSKFHPTPIISPIYGILDKNYRKEEVIDRKDRPSSYVSRKNADLDSIRKKAYGDVSILGDEKVEKKEEITEDPLLYDMMVDDTKPVVDQVTVADAEEYFTDLGLEYNVDYKDGRYEQAIGRKVSSSTNVKKEENKDNDDANLGDNLFDLVDSMYGESE